MFVALNAAGDMNADLLPKWLRDAQRTAEGEGGVRKVISWRSPRLSSGGSNALPILIGPVSPGFSMCPFMEAFLRTCANLS